MLLEATAVVDLPSLLLSLPLKGAFLIEDCEELWKEAWGNMDTRGLLQLSVRKKQDVYNG